MARAIEALALKNIPFRAFAEIGKPAERIAAIAERERVDEVMMGVGRHPAWLRWVNPSIAQAVMEQTDIPVTVLARGQAGAFERYALPAGVAGLAALLLAGE
jgi:nucleotide-binding universal stress UspA family protein